MLIEIFETGTMNMFLLQIICLEGVWTSPPLIAKIIIGDADHNINNLKITL